MRWIALPMVVVLASVSCAQDAEEQGEDTAAVGDSMMAAAEAAYDASVFDTITWESEEAFLARGKQVYTISCAKCHGPGGLGDAEFVMGGDTLRPRSFREPMWPLAGDIDGIRKAIFVGTAEGMPHWGMQGLKAEMVESVAHYILEGLGGD